MTSLSGGNEQLLKSKVLTCFASPLSLIFKNHVSRLFKVLTHHLQLLGQRPQVMYDHIWGYNGVTGCDVSLLFVKLGTVPPQVPGRGTSIKRLLRAGKVKLSNQLHLLVIGGQ